MSVALHILSDGPDSVEIMAVGDSPQDVLALKVGKEAEKLAAEKLPRVGLLRQPQAAPVDDELHYREDWCLNPQPNMKFGATYQFARLP